MITFTDMNNPEAGIALAEDPTTEFKYWNSHNGGYKDTKAFGLWVRDDGEGIKFAMDHGEVTHCLNQVSITPKHGVRLSEWSIGGTYFGDGEKEFVKSHTFDCYWVGRLRIDSQEELEALLLANRSFLDTKFKNLGDLLKYIKEVN